MWQFFRKHRCPPRAGSLNSEIHAASNTPCPLQVPHCAPVWREQDLDTSLVVLSDMHGTLSRSARAPMGLSKLLRGFLEPQGVSQSRQPGRALGVQLTMLRYVGLTRSSAMYAPGGFSSACAFRCWCPAYGGLRGPRNCECVPDLVLPAQVCDRPSSGTEVTRDRQMSWEDHYILTPEMSAVEQIFQRVIVIYAL